MTIAVVGAGVAGCTLARRLAERGHAITVFEREAEVGGLCRDGYDPHGILVHWHGPHIWHTSDPQAHAWMSRFAEWRLFQHHVVASDGYGQVVPVPINAVTRSMLPRWNDDELAILLYDGYGRKMWGEHFEAVQAAVERRVAVRDSRDCSYYGVGCRWQGLPLTGWVEACRRMLDYDRIAVATNTAFSTPDPEYDLTLWTGRPEPLLDWRLGPLAYRTMRFDFTTGRGSTRQAYPVVNWPTTPPDHVRSTDYRRLTGQDHEYWAVGYETPAECGADGRPTHVVPSAANLALWQAYAGEIARAHPRVRLVGRFAECRYLDLAESVSNALSVADEISS